ncbi:hypothetical protein DAPPUDRAFT_277568, partial [Daphnia pulex]
MAGSSPPPTNIVYRELRREWVRKLKRKKNPRIEREAKQPREKVRACEAREA